MTVMHFQRDANIEADVRLSDDQRIVAKQGVFTCVRDDQRNVLFNSSRAKRYRPWRLSHFKPLLGFEPLTVTVNQRHQNDWNLQCHPCEARDSIKGLLWSGIEDIVTLERREPSFFIDRIIALHRCPRMLDWPMTTGLSFR